MINESTMYILIHLSTVRNFYLIDKKAPNPELMRSYQIHYTVQLHYNEPRYNAVLSITRPCHAS